MNFCGLLAAALLALVGQTIYTGYQAGLAKRDFVGANGYGFFTTAEQVAEGVDLGGKVALVTGANSGLGLENARVFALRGAHVIVVARSLSKANGAIASLRSSLPAGSSPQLTPLACDLSSLASVDAAVAAFKAMELPLHYLIANAGIMALPERQASADGLEMQVAVNHLGHFHLITSLTDTLVASAPARVVLVSSLAHEHSPNPRAFLESDNLEMPYNPWGTYGDSKLCNIIMAKELTARLGSKGVLAYSLHPGLIETNLGRNMGLASVVASLQSFGSNLPAMIPLMGRSIPQGTATQVYAALKAPSAEAGMYFDKCNVQTVGFEYTHQEDAGLVDNAAVRAKFWATSQKLVNKALQK